MDMLFQLSEIRNVLKTTIMFSVMGAVAAGCGGNEAKTQEAAKTTAEPPPDAGPATPELPPHTETVAPEGAPSAAADVKSTAEQNVIDECAIAAETFRQSMKKPMDACYQTAKKENPYLSGVAKFVISFNYKSAMTSVRPDPSTLTKKSIECMVAAIKGSKWSDPACKDKSMTLTRPYERAGE